MLWKNKKKNTFVAEIIDIPGKSMTEMIEAKKHRANLLL